MHALVLLCTFAAADPVLDFPDRARALVQAMNKGDFAAAAKDFDATMTKVLPPDKLKAIWEQVTGRFGAFEQATGTRMEEKGKITVVFVECKFAQGPLDVRVAFD